MAQYLDYPRFFANVNKPIVWTFHDQNPFFGLFHYKNDEQKNLVDFGELNNCVKNIKEKSIHKFQPKIKFVCPSLWLQHELQQSNFCPNIESICIPYPVDFEVFHPQNTNALRKSLGISEDHTVLLFVSQTVENYRKGFDLLKQAVEQLKDLLITLIVVGESWLFEFGQINYIHVGEINDNTLLSQYYSLADAFIIPSREDNLPNVMLEAFACGTPVISFNVGGMRDEVIDHVNGLKATKVESASLLETLQYFIENKATFNRQEIHLRAKSKYSPQTVSDAYRKVYSSILS
jgi:glycosyltransferase involved in cell wall biosynthesis